MDSTDKMIAVIMSTYNGELYLAEQIDSILNQEDVDFKLFIRDDGSVDSTPDILLEYSQKYSNVFFCNQGERKNIGIKDSFLCLLKEVAECNTQIEYFAFADQDDIWKKDKLKSALARLLETRETNNPKLYYSNKTFVDKQLNLITEEKIKFYGDFFDVLWASQASGCTMVFNRALAICSQIKNPSGELYLHDSWIYRLAVLCGADIVFDSQSHILYRQHEKNTCGTNALRMIDLDTWERIFKKSPHRVQKKIEEICSISDDIVCEKYRKYAHWVLTYNKSLSSWFHLALSPLAFRRGPILYCVFFMKLILFRI